jgi:tartrate dehydrogenase/decarboxylase/D-malate dehydrogenase
VSAPAGAAAHRVAVIGGDGIGPEVVRVAQEVVDAAAGLDGGRVTWTELDWGCERYLREGALMPEDGLDLLREHDAVLLGAVGWPGVPDHVSLWGLLIPIRRTFRQYVNLRPVRVLPGVSSPVRGGDAMDLVIVRENVEGEYSEVGGRMHRGFDDELAVQEAIFTRAGVARVTRYAADLAASRRGALVSATKSNGIIHSMPFWDEVVAEVVASEFPGIRLRSELIDALAAKVVLDPASFDVIVASNLFGDILSDLAAAVGGSIGIAPSANLDPTGQHPSMFEPVHGSAPDIAGKGVANPVGAVWSAQLMLEQLGLPRAAEAVMTAIERTTADPATRTRDLGGTATTDEVRAALLAALPR